MLGINGDAPESRGLYLATVLLIHIQIRNDVASSGYCGVTSSRTAF